MDKGRDNDEKIEFLGVGLVDVVDDNYMIGSLDWNTGEISLNKTTGTATLKALYNHFNVNSTYQPSECTFTITVVDPSAITYYALVAEYDGKHLALTNTLSSGTYSATEVDAVNGKLSLLRLIRLHGR